MVIRILSGVVTMVLLLHAAIHLLGFVAYWPLATVDGLPYRTAIVGQRWEVGSTGMRAFSVAWLLVALGLAAAAVARLLGQSWWLPLLLGAAAASVILGLGVWSEAKVGVLVSIAVIAAGLVALGLRLEPEPFAAVERSEGTDQTVELAADLPPPVASFYRSIGAEPVPVIDSAVISATGTVALAGVRFPARLRFIHDAGEGYRHYIETTLYRRPVMGVNEWYLDGAATLELPFGTVEDEPKVDLAANLGLWGESIWLPTVYLTDPRVTWEPIDDATARLVVPTPDGGEDAFTVHFDPATDLVTRLETVRYKAATDAEKTEWVLDVSDWRLFDGLLLPVAGTATWADDDGPWLVVEVTDIVFNTDVSTSIRSRGP